MQLLALDKEKMAWLLGFPRPEPRRTHETVEDEYVVSSGRPAHELSAPRAPLRRESYDNEFVGMTREAVPWTALVETRRRLVEDIGSRLRGDVAAFLLSVHDAEPDFGLIGLPRAALLPAVRWKVENLERLRRANPEKHGAQRDALERLVR